MSTYDFHKKLEEVFEGYKTPDYIYNAEYRYDVGSKGTTVSTREHKISLYVRSGYPDKVKAYTYKIQENGRMKRIDERIWDSLEEIAMWLGLGKTLPREKIGE